MISAAAFMTGLTPTAISFGVCLVACLGIFAQLGGAPGAARPTWPRPATTGAALGLVVWIQPFVALSFPARPGLSLLGVTESLALSIGSAIWAIAAFARCRGALRVIAPGAILGLGVAASHGVLLMSLSGAADFSFDDAPFSLGVAVASGSAAAAFAMLMVWRRPFAAAAALAAGLVGSQMLARAAVGFQPIPAADMAALPILRFAPLVAGSILASAVALQMGTRHATTDRDGRGSSRPARAPRQAGTKSPHPTPVR